MKAAIVLGVVLSCIAFPAGALIINQVYVICQSEAFCQEQGLILDPGNCTRCLDPGDVCHVSTDGTFDGQGNASSIVMNSNGVRKAPACGPLKGKSARPVRTKP